MDDLVPQTFYLLPHVLAALVDVDGGQAGDVVHQVKVSGGLAGDDSVGLLQLQLQDTGDNEAGSTEEAANTLYEYSNFFFRTNRITFTNHSLEWLLHEITLGSKRVDYLVEYRQQHEN